MFTSADIVRLRTMTGAGMMDCKKALTETNGNMDEAVKYLREKGIAAMAKKAERIAAEGAVGTYNHLGGKIGVLVEVNCETDFVAKSDAFQALVKDLAMHIAAAKPEYVSVSEVPAQIIENEKEILRVQALSEGKPAAVVEKMVEGRVKKFYKDVVLLEQEFVKNPDLTIAQLISESTLQIGEKISIRRFVRYEMGEGLTKKSDNLADEVAKMTQAK